MEELGAHEVPWNLDTHLQGCLSAYQAAPSYSTAVYFALEAVWGIGKETERQGDAGEIPAEEHDPEWTKKPTAAVEVPWIWIKALAHAWGRYQEDGGPIGQAFGLEGGQGRAPADTRLQQLLDDRAIARWIWHHLQDKRAAGHSYTITAAISDSAILFERSEDTIRRAWRRFGAAEKKAAAARGA